MALAEKISKQSSIDCVMWLLVTSLMLSYNVKEQQNRENYKLQFEEERSTSKYKGPKSSAQGNEEFKEKPEHKWNKACCDLRVRSHPASLPTCEKGL